METIDTLELPFDTVETGNTEVETPVQEREPAGELTVNIQAVDIPASEEVPGEVAMYANIWTKYRVALQAFCSELGKMQTEEREARGNPDFFYGIVPGMDDRPLDKFHENVIDRLCRMAEVAFAAASSRLEIPRDEFRELPFAQIETFDPVALWKHLKETYDTDEGKAASYRLTCTALTSAAEISPYRRNKDQDMRTVSGRAILTIHTYGDWSYNFNGRESICKFIQALKCVAIWGGIWNHDDEAVDTMIHKIQTNRGSDTRTLGKMDYWPLVHLVSYKEKVEFRLAAALAEQTQIFLATYNSPRED